MLYPATCVARPSPWIRLARVPSLHCTLRARQSRLSPTARDALLLVVQVSCWILMNFVRSVHSASSVLTVDVSLLTHVPMDMHVVTVSACSSSNILMMLSGMVTPFALLYGDRASIQMAEYAQSFSISKIFRWRELN